MAALKQLRKDLLLVAVPADKAPMKAYMKNQFDFLGVKSKARRDAARPHISSWLKEVKDVDEVLVRELWQQPEREFQYIAIDYLNRTQKYWRPEHLTMFHSLIIDKSWWDTVDGIASQLVGGIIKKFPELRKTMKAWNESENIWLIRTSIIYQLKYKDEVDFEELKRFILRHHRSKEFFIQKASGWALRQYAKFRPFDVKQFVLGHELPSLTKREAMKHLKDK